VVKRLQKRWLEGWPLTPYPSPRSGEGRRWLVLLAVLAGLPILVHGCHRDEDNELLVPLIGHAHDRGTGQ
jgi:hypothetical protein